MIEKLAAVRLLTLSAVLFCRKDSKWQDDKAERPVVLHDTADADVEQGESVADLRREARVQEEKHIKQRAYEDMQQKLADSEMTYLDRIRYEVENS